MAFVVAPARLSDAFASKRELKGTLMGPWPSLSATVLVTPSRKVRSAGSTDANTVQSGLWAGPRPLTSQ